MTVRFFFSLFCLLLFCRLQRCAGMKSRTAFPAAFLRPGFVRAAMMWNLQPWLRLASDERTRLGRPIPGLARNSQCCGKVNVGSKIVGGVATHPNEFPWMTALVDPGLEEPFCGGALINDLYVLTAAHCVWDLPSPAEIEVILGKHNFTSNSGNDLRLGVSNIIVHPLFTNDIGSDDIALLKLDRRLSLPIGDNLIAPICLPHRRLYRNDDALVAGWGDLFEEAADLPNQLQKVQLTTISNWLCTKRLNFTSPLIKPTMICTSAVPKEAEQDTCYGDSGSAVMVAARHPRPRLSVIGVVSWGVGCARPRLPGVHSRVTYFLDWIVFNTRDATYC